MLKSIFLAMMGIMLFIGGGAGAWYFAQWQHGQELKQAEEAKEAEEHAPPANLEQVQKENPIAIAVRPEGLSPEDVFRMSALMQEQTAALQKREAALNEKQSRLNVVTEDLSLQQRDLQGMLAQVHDTLAAARTILSEIQNAEKRVKDEKDKAQSTLQELEKNKRDDDVNRAKNVQKAASLLQQMNAQGSAAAIRQYCDEGKSDFAIELLSLIEQRKAAEILNSLEDPALVAELAERFQTIRRPTETKR
jgi:chromosome segregation ATPase